ncbi:MAG: HAD family hydrolase [Ignavibacteriae bacterium]|nr:MAG: HAD family hydrolase [Ignavibacteriota bacterium]
MQIENYQHIIWDWNGTLLNDVQMCADIMNNLLKVRSLPTITLEKYKEIFTFPVKDYYIKAGHNFENESFEKIGKDFIDEYEKRKTECALYPFAAEVLEIIRSLKIEQHLLSAYKQNNLEDIIKHFGIKEYFYSVRGLDHIYADGKIELGKQLMNEISSNGKGSKVLLIGDTVHDYEVAKGLNIDCLLVSSGHQNIEKLKSLNIPVIKNLKELFLLMRGKGSKFC